METQQIMRLIVYLTLSLVGRYTCFENVITYLGHNDMHPASYAKYTSWNSESKGIITFSFITSNPNGLLLHVGDSNLTEWTRNYFEVRIQNGMLNFISRIKNGTNMKKWKRVWYIKDVDDLKWHRVQIRRDGINVMVELDGEQLLVQFGVERMQPVRLKGVLYMGGLPHGSVGHCDVNDLSHQFVGAIKNVRYGPLFNINSGYERLLNRYGTIWGYQDPCTKFRQRRSICHHGGICVNKFSNYSCDCLGTGYEGRNCNIVSTSVNFKGLDYVEWKPLQKRRSSEANEISLRFKTLEPSGVLIYIGNSTNYLVIELYRGQLLVGLRLDTEKLTVSASNTTFNDNRWHLVQVSRREMNLKVSLNRTNTTQSRVPGSSLRRHLKDSKIYIGGKGYLHWLPGTLSKQFFMGCLQQIYYNGGSVIKSIVNSYRTKNKRRTKHGNIVQGCPSRATKAPFTRGPRSRRYRPTFAGHTKQRGNIKERPSKPSSRTKTIGKKSRTMLIVGIIMGVIVLIVVIAATGHYLRSKYRREIALTAVYTKSPYENGASASCGTMSMYISPSSSGEKSDRLRGIAE